MKIAFFPLPHHFKESVAVRLEIILVTRHAGKKPHAAAARTGHKKFAQGFATQRKAVFFKNHISVFTAEIFPDKLDHAFKITMGNALEKSACQSLLLKQPPQPHVINARAGVSGFQHVMGKVKSLGHGMGLRALGRLKVFNTFTRVLNFPEPFPLPFQIPRNLLTVARFKLGPIRGFIISHPHRKHHAAVPEHGLAAFQINHRLIMRVPGAQRAPDQGIGFAGKKIGGRVIVEPPHVRQRPHGRQMADERVKAPLAFRFKENLSASVFIRVLVKNPLLFEDFGSAAGLIDENAETFRDRHDFADIPEHRVRGLQKSLRVFLFGESVQMRI